MVSVVTVDYDLENVDNPLCYWVVLKHKLEAIARHPKVRRVKVCETNKGKHIYLLVDDDMELEETLPLRAYLCDDPNRIEIDIERIRYGVPETANVLFTAKYEYRKGRVTYKSREGFCYTIK